MHYSKLHGYQCVSAGSYTDLSPLEGCNPAFHPVIFLARNATYTHCPVSVNFEGYVLLEKSPGARVGAPTHFGVLSLHTEIGY